MRIGGYEIEGVSRRFWAVVGGFVTLIVAAVVAFVIFSPPPANPLFDPAFPASRLNALKPGWIDPYISQYGINRARSDQAFSAQYSQAVGLPFRFKAFVPEDDPEIKAERPDLYVNQSGWTFGPAVFIDPTQTIDPQAAQQIAATEFADTPPLLLGFRAGDAPVPGRGYEFTGLLFWRSDSLKPPKPVDGEQPPPPSPVILVDSFKALSAAELRAPTTHAVDLGLTYQQAGLQLSLSRIEWSAGREVRACVAISNPTSRALPMWQGVSQMTVDVGNGPVAGQPDSDNLLGQAQTIDPGQRIPGYVVFGKDAAVPASKLTLRAPSLSANGASVSPTESDQFRVEVDPGRILDLSKAKNQSRFSAGGCSGQSTAGVAGIAATGGESVLGPLADSPAEPAQGIGAALAAQTSAAGNDGVQ